MRIVSTDEMQEIEQQSFTRYGLTERLVIENVGNSSAAFLFNKLFKGNVEEKKEMPMAILLLGKGTNAADGLAVARHLLKYGIESRGFLLFSESECNPEVAFQLKLAREFGVKIGRLNDVNQLTSFLSQSPENYFLIDAIFGTGVRLPLSHFLYEVIDLVNQVPGFVVSLDMPSGVESDTGKVQGNAIKANLTLAMGAYKIGHFVGEGAKYSGEVTTLDVGFPPQLFQGGDKTLLQKKDVLDLHSERSKYAHKNNFGHSLIMGGSHGLTGALVLATEAAMATGTGLVTGVTWQLQYKEFMMRLRPEVMTGFIPKDEAKWVKLIRNLNNYDSIVLGPGLGISARARKVVLTVLAHYNGPVILDADAINVLSLKEDEKIFSERNAPTILTPHFGEFARFAEVPMQELLEHPVQELKKLMERISCPIILKGACTYIGLLNGTTYFNNFPNDGMAKGGSGDILAGILGGLLAQLAGTRKGGRGKTASRPLSEIYQVDKEFEKTVCLGVLLHSLAGLHAANKYGERSMKASDIIEGIGLSYKDFWS